MIDLTIHQQGRANNIKKARENGILIPTISQMQHPRYGGQVVPYRLS